MRRVSYRVLVVYIEHNIGIRCSAATVCSTSSVQSPLGRLAHSPPSPVDGGGGGVGHTAGVGHMAM